MTINRRLFLVAIIAFAAGTLLTAAQSQRPPAPRDPSRPRLGLRVSNPPTVAIGADGAVLVYELWVTNAATDQWTIQKVEVLSADKESRVLQTIEGSDLDSMIGRPGTSVSRLERRVLAGAGWGLVYFWVPIDRDAPPSSIFHRVTVQLNRAGASATADVEGSTVPVMRDRPIIGPPLRGGSWRVGNGPSNTSNHRRTFSVQAANLTNPERFAIDYVKVGEDGMPFSRDELVNENHHAFGAEVLAVADGVVVAAKNDLPDQDPRVERLPPSPETAPGNYVILDIGRGAYAMYAHLRPASLRVTVGARVKRGQVIGLLGNSGNSRGPHLHFQIQDTPVLSSEGLPYAHESFELVGQCDPQPLGRCEPKPPVSRRNEIPLAGMLVQFSR
jgi:murein DD-endopeptidase